MGFFFFFFLLQGFMEIVSFVCLLKFLSQTRNAKQNHGIVLPYPRDLEGPGCCLNNEDSSNDFFIAAKFLTNRALNVDALAETFTHLWRARNGFKIQRIGDHKILFSFDNKADVDRIMISEPWSFDKH